MKSRDELEAELRKLGWAIVAGLVQTANGWKATMRRGTANVPMTGVKELDLLEEMVRFSQKRRWIRP